MMIMMMIHKREGEVKKQKNKQRENREKTPQKSYLKKQLDTKTNIYKSHTHTHTNTHTHTPYLISQMTGYWNQGTLK